MLHDSQDQHYLLRRRMVATQIRARGIGDPRVLAAMEEVPRERFVPPSRQHEAFNDCALGIAYGQTISQPYVVAAMTVSLALAPDHRVLEIGTGSGYQTAILARLVREVYTIERVEPLLESASLLLDELGLRNVHYRAGDGSEGWPEAAPFDRIIVTAAAPEVPQSLIDQLVDGGRIVIPVGSENDQTLTVVERRGNRTLETPQFPCRFVKLIGTQAWPEYGDAPQG